ncbi:uncharacterized protein LOC121422752 [Lytechinus variegatus]|uniref:uncharacterized protein LOC121422752 n=1 Tax=Lytechinus variegatus TaxID=7654 RepID=UPI001BB15920|nr:uncharacterized protein LOC121422752 [Lytechinus variegatus]
MMDRCTRILRSPCSPIFLILLMESCSKIGLVKAMGILFADLSKSIEMTSADLGIALGLFYTLGLLITPLVAFVITRTSHPRILLIFGATMGCSPIIIASQATQNWHLFLTFAISGAGYCVLRMTSLTALDRLAGEHFNLLFSLSTCGYSAGMVLFPFLAEELLMAYGWRDVYLILGGLMLNGIPCALAIQITQETFNIRDKEELQRRDQVGNDTSLTGSNGCCPDASTENGVVDAVADTDPLLTPSAGHDHIDIGVDLTLPKDETSPTRYFDYIASFPGKISSCIGNMGFYDDPFSVFIFLSIAMFFFVYNGWHDFLVPHALQRGISEQNTIILTFVAAVGNFSSRLIIALLTHHSVDPISIFLVLSIIDMVSLACDVCLPHYYVMLVTSSCSAATIAGRAVLGIIIIRNRVSSENLPMALGVNNVVEAFGFFLGGYLSGLVADKFSTYNASFILLASVDVFAFVFMMFPKVLKKPEVSSDVKN